MTTKYHVALSVRGALQWSKSELKRNAKGFKRDDGTNPTPGELKSFLFDQLASGVELLPLGECDNFHPKKGCMGHPCAENDGKDVNK